MKSGTARGTAKRNTSRNSRGTDQRKASTGAGLPRNTNRNRACIPPGTFHTTPRGGTPEQVERIEAPGGLTGLRLFFTARWMRRRIVERLARRLGASKRQASRISHYVPLKDHRMTDQTHLSEDFRALAHAALRVGGRLMSDVTPEQEAAIERALQGGSRLVFEFGPLPAFDHAMLVLVEPEGRRHRLCTVSLAAGPTQ